MAKWTPPRVTLQDARLEVLSSHAYTDLMGELATYSILLDCLSHWKLVDGTEYYGDILVVDGKEYQLMYSKWLGDIDKE